MAVAQKTGTQNGTLVSGNVDRNQRNPPWFNFEPHPHVPVVIYVCICVHGCQTFIDVIVFQIAESCRGSIFKQGMGGCDSEFWQAAVAGYYVGVLEGVRASQNSGQVLLQGAIAGCCCRL